MNILKILYIQHPWEVLLRESAINKSLKSKISNIWGWCVFDVWKWFINSVKSSISLISNIQERCSSGNLRLTNPWYPRYPISKGVMYLIYLKIWSHKSTISSISNIHECCISDIIVDMNSNQIDTEKSNFTSISKDNPRYP